VTALNRKLLRELARSWGLLLAIVSIMAVGVTCFVGMQSVYFSLSDARLSYYNQCRMADFWIDLKKVPLSEVDAVAALPGIRELRPRIQFSVTVDIEEATDPINGLVLSLPNTRQPVINDIVLRQGDYFTPRRRNEVIVNDAFARKHRLYPGETLHLLLNNRREELFVVGTAISSEFTYLLGPGSFVPDPEHFGVFYLKDEYAEDVFDMQGAANQLVGTFAPGQESLGSESLRRAELLLEPYGVFQTTPLRQQQSNQFIKGEIDQIGMFATIFPTVFLIVAALVLNVLMMRLTRQQRTIIGTFKAIGYTNGQIFAHYLKFGLLVGVVAGVLGGIGGYLDAMLVTTMYGWYFQFPRLDNVVYPGTYATGIGLALACSWVGSWYGARAALKLAPAQAMRPEPPKQGRGILLERIGLLWNRLSADWRMIVRNLVRSRVRTGMSIFSAAMGASLMVNGFMLVEATRFLLDFQFNQMAKSDIDLTFEDARGIEALDEVRRLPGVDAAEPMLGVSCTLVHGPYQRKSAVTGILRNARMTTPRDGELNKIPLPESGVVLTQRLAEILHARPGDRITMVPVKGDRRPVELVVSNIADSYLGMAAYAELGPLSAAVGEELAITGAQIQVDNNPKHLLELYRDLKQMPGIQAVAARRDMMKNLTDTMITNQRIFIGILVTFAGVVFLGSIVNASLISLAERTSEVATLRAIGYGPWRIGSLYLRESLLTTLVGTALGVPGGAYLTWLMANSYENDMLTLPVVTANWVWQMALGLAVLFTLLAHSIVQLSIHRMNVVEALKVKE
jgi:putative ABC transport system permease protein